MRYAQGLVSNTMGQRPPSLAARSAASSSADLRSATSAKPLLSNGWPQHRSRRSPGTTTSKPALRNSRSAIRAATAPRRRRAARPSCARHSSESRPPARPVDAGGRRLARGRGGSRKRRRPFGQPTAGPSTQRVERAPHRARADETVDHVGGSESRPHARRDGSEVIRDSACDAMRERRRSLCPAAP